MGNNFIKQLIILVTTTTFLHAQDNLIKIAHETRSVQLPLASETMKISAVIAGNNSIAQLRGFFSIDGELIEAHSEIGKLNSNEMMEYTFSLPAPKFQLDYQFYGESNSAIAASSRYVVKRPCMDDLNIEESPVGTAVIENERKKAKKLEHQIKLIEQSTLSAEYLAKEIK